MAWVGPSSDKLQPVIQVKEPTTNLDYVKIGPSYLGFEVGHPDHHRPHPRRAFVHQLPADLHLHAGDVAGTGPHSFIR